MGSFTGTATLIRLILRRDRIALLIWIFLLAFLPIGFATSYRGLYPTEAMRQAFANETNASSEVALLGRVTSSSLGGLTAWRWSTAAAILLGAFGLITVIRHTRVEEESGRRELVESAVIGRYASLSAALIVTFAADLLIGALAAVGLISLGIPMIGSIALGLSAAAIGWLFASMAAVAAQLTQNAGAARGLVGWGLGLLYLIRVIGDSGVPWLSWLSPLGWMRFVNPFAIERWWVFGLFFIAIIGLLVLAYRLSTNRDLDAGFLPERSGPVVAAASLKSPVALAWRLQRSMLSAWVLGFALVGTVFGYVAKSGSDQLMASEGVKAYFEQFGNGSGPSDGFFTLALMILVELVAVNALLAALRLRGEEAAQRVDPLLAGPVKRLRWATSHLFFAFTGPVAILAAFGLTAGLTYGLSVGQSTSQLLRVLAAALAYAPAMWVVAGIATAQFGLAPRWTALSWATIVVMIFIDLGGEFRFLDQAILNISPLTHIPRVLLGQGNPIALIGLTMVALLFVFSGMVGFKNRDVG
ncbi:MAG: ABC transporter permease [Bacteroidota bacterium]